MGAAVSLGASDPPEAEAATPIRSCEPAVAAAVQRVQPAVTVVEVVQPQLWYLTRRRNATGVDEVLLGGAAAEPQKKGSEGGEIGWRGRVAAGVEYSRGDEGLVGVASDADDVASDTRRT
jgi:hypothetical protein